MAKIAVDVVLLPLQETTDRAIEANRKLLKQRAGGIILDKKNCLPHITVGHGRITDFSSPVEFTASQLALCHLGNYCTCRKVLAAAELKS